MRCRLGFLIVGVLLLAVFFMQAVPCVPVLAQDAKPILEMNLLYGNFNGTVKTGQNNIIFMEVRNGGNTSLHDIVFSSLAPGDWRVTFDPATISSLEAGAYQNIEISIQPSSTADRDNNITFIAQSDETRQILNTYLQVESNGQSWIWIGVGLAIVLAVVFIFLFRRLNRT